MPEQQLVVDYHSGPAVLQLRQHGWLRRAGLRLLLRKRGAPTGAPLLCKQKNYDEDKAEKSVFIGWTDDEMALFSRKNTRKNIEIMLDFLSAIL